MLLLSHFHTNKQQKKESVTIALACISCTDGHLTNVLLSLTIAKRKVASGSTHLHSTCEITPNMPTLLALAGFG